jgi:hypothetical protein
MHALVRCVLAVGCALAAGTSWATSITYDVSNVTGNTWQYDFTVNNNSLGVPIGEFTLYFDYNLFSNLSAVSQPAEYTIPGLSGSPLVVQPQPGSPLFPIAQDGFVDYLASDAGLAPGGTLDSFIVDANFSGSGTPGGPSFQVVDANFNTLDSGLTTPAGAPSVDEPGTLGLLGVGLLAVLTGYRRARRA